MATARYQIIQAPSLEALADQQEWAALLQGVHRVSFTLKSRDRLNPDQTGTFKMEDCLVLDIEHVGSDRQMIKAELFCPTIASARSSAKHNATATVMYPDGEGVIEFHW